MQIIGLQHDLIRDSSRASLSRLSCTPRAVIYRLSLVSFSKQPTEEISFKKFMDASNNRESYTTECQMASYLEAEWSDFLFMQKKPKQGFPDPRNDLIYPSFYLEVSSLIKQWLVAELILPKHYLDVGGATGRTLYEVYSLFPSLTDLVLVEPSPKFCSWARKILLEKGDLGYVPIVNQIQKPSYAKSLGRPEPLQQNTLKSVFVYEGFVESVPRPSSHFDLITCLNVVDRHPNPPLLVKTLYNLLVPNGILIFASPMDFDEVFTPDKSQWVENLNLLFSNDYWRSIGDNDIPYDFRFFKRGFVRLVSQVVAKQKR